MHQCCSIANYARMLFLEHPQWLASHAIVLYLPNGTEDNGDEDDNDALFETHQCLERKASSRFYAILDAEGLRQNS